MNSPTSEGTGIIRALILGGAGEIGMNCLLLQERKRIIMIDCGVAFPSRFLPGVDVLIPDFQWIEQRAHLLEGIVLTHGHEDHIGALPYFLKRVDVPVYGTRSTLGLIEEKLKEHRLKKAKLLEIKAGEKRQIGGFDLEFIQTCHSVVDGVAVAWHSEQGIILHSGDFKLDPTPVDGKVMDLNALSRLGEQGVLAFFSDSTNVEQEGYTPSEQEVGKTLQEIFLQAKGRIIVSVFSSHIQRIQQVLDTAQKLKRKVLIYGKSIEASTRIAHQLGYLSYPSTLLVSLNQARAQSPDKIIILTTGSQAEPLSVLSRMAKQEHPHLKILPGDVVVLSSKFIPGNEIAIQELINQLYRLGAEVFYEKTSEIHCSGHAGQEELKIVLGLVRPKYLIPIHGEYRHLVKHKQLAIESGLKPEQCLVVEDGEMIEFENQHARIISRINLTPEYLNGSKKLVPQVVIQERLQMAEQGLVLVSLDANRSNPRIKLKTMGLLLEREAQELLFEAEEQSKNRLKFLLEKNSSKTEIEKSLKKYLKKFFKRHLGHTPVIIINRL